MNPSYYEIIAQNASRNYPMTSCHVSNSRQDHFRQSDRHKVQHCLKDGKYFIRDKLSQRRQGDMVLGKSNGL